MVSRYNWPMAQTTACPSHSPTNDHLLWSEKMRFSNPCKYMLMGFQNLIFRFVYSGLSSCAPEKLNNSNKYFLDTVKRSLVPRLYVWNLNLLWDLTNFSLCLDQILISMLGNKYCSDEDCFEWYVLCTISDLIPSYLYYYLEASIF